MALTATQKKKRLNPKQIYKPLGALVGISGFTILNTTSSGDVTADITSALSTAGNDGVSVVVSVAASDWDTWVKTGVISDVYDIEGNKINDGNGNEVYARVTEAAGVYTLSLYSLIAWAETAFVAANDIVIDFYFTYQFNFNDLPANALTDVKTKRVNDDIKSSAKILKEVITIATINTIPDVIKTISDVNKVTLIVNGVSYFSGAANPAITATAPKSVSFSAINAGFDLETTDTVEIEYPTNQ